jgi:septum formation protein
VQLRELTERTDTCVSRFSAGRQEREHLHAGCDAGLDAELRVFDHRAFGGAYTQRLAGVQEELWLGLPSAHRVRAKNAAIELVVQAHDAQRMLEQLSGRTHVVMTAVAASHEGHIVSSLEKVSVTFRRLSHDEQSSYIRTGEPMDKAGAYGIQGFGATIVTRIDGDYFAVMGLSLIRLVDLITSLGIRYNFGR